jgi:hypothetical protein
VALRPRLYRPRASGSRVGVTLHARASIRCTEGGSRLG